ncbi:hypothetical protein PM10SUCC1_38700 [Propionigenium maris DSM 9537]|uniref:Uncharacterized protein n=1 Tax=Propionigenium maris DSM 9537 TaxID=1123000 RepID=A0A9W6GQE7_9FUSO|nr:hypothetical protein [Propionigenium maris]GLI58356.1 hypothetical protein PM10SUCC1_38700 [Propionigenium maris DSM 9537]
MKRLILVAMIVLGSISYSRDLDYRGRNEFMEVSAEIITTEDKVSRMSSGEISLKKNWYLNERDRNFERYSNFHRDLENQDRGNQK